MKDPFKILRRIELIKGYKLQRAYYMNISREEIEAQINKENFLIATFLILHGVYWLEGCFGGILIVSLDTTLSIDIIAEFERESNSFEFNIDPEGHIQSTKKIRLTEYETGMLTLVMAIQNLIADNTKKAHTVLEVDPSRVEVWKPKGNKTQLVRVYRNFWNPVDSGEKREMIIKKRDHAVRGHWRYYLKSNRRSWVRQHRRGDPALGTVITNQIIDP